MVRLYKKFELTENDLLFFLHIPKTAGTTLIQYLDMKFSRGKIFRYRNHDDVYSLSPVQFNNYNLIRAHIGYELVDYLPKFPQIVTFLRNPIERTISQFEFNKRQFSAYPPNQKDSVKYEFYKRYCSGSGGTAKLQQKIESSNGFDDYINDKMFQDFEISNIQTRFIAGSNIAGRKSVNKNDSGLLEKAKNNLMKFRFAGLAERFDDSLLMLAFLFGWKPVSRIPSYNVAPEERLKQKDLSKSTITKLTELTALDFELYNYAEQMFKKNFESLNFEAATKSYETVMSRKPRINNVHIDFSEPVERSGFYEFEPVPEDGSGYCWSGPGTVSTIDLPLATDKDLRISFLIGNCPAPDILESLKVFVNGNELKLEEPVLLNHGEIFKARIPVEFLGSKRKPAMGQSANDNFTELKFTINRTISPSELNPGVGDSRKLGLMYRWIDIYPDCSEKM